MMPDDPQPQSSRGVATSEFWTAIAAGIAAVVPLLSSQDWRVQIAALGAISVIVAGYCVGRGLAKR